MNKVQDEKGRFVKGHPPTFFEHKPGSKALLNVGRPKSIEGKVKDALELAREAMPEIITMLIAKANAGDVEAAKYLCDRIYGKANQPLSNPDGKVLPTFAFVVPGGYVPQPGGLFSGEVKQN